MEHQQRENESFLDWKLRLITGKIEKTIDLDWSEIRDLLGLECSADHLRKTAYGIYEYKEYIDEKVTQGISDDEVLKEYEFKRVELQKEKVKLQDVKTEYNKLIRESARFESFLDAIQKAVKESNLKEYKSLPKQYVTSNKELVSVWSDFHYGIGVNNEFGSFNKEIFRERFFKYIDKVIEIGKLHNVKRVVVLELGDAISGVIHQSLRLQGVDNVVNQVQEVSEIMSDGLFRLSENFEQVDMYLCSGNHGRVSSSKEESLSQENFEKFIPWYLKSRLSNVKHIAVHDNQIAEIIQTEVCGHKIVGVHGENDKPNAIVYNLPLMLKYIPSTIFTGHYHHYFEDSIHGVDVVGCGSVVGTDEFAKSIRKTGYPCQTVCVYGDEGKECTYNVKLK